MSTMYTNPQGNLIQVDDRVAAVQIDVHCWNHSLTNHQAVAQANVAARKLGLLGHYVSSGGSIHFTDDGDLPCNIRTFVYIREA